MAWIQLGDINGEEDGESQEDPEHVIVSSRSGLPEGPTQALRG